MKSLNDLIWDEDINLEEGKEDDITISRIKEICLISSCHPPKPVPVAPNHKCIP